MASDAAKVASQFNALLYRTYHAVAISSSPPSPDRSQRRQLSVSSKRLRNGLTPASSSAFRNTSPLMVAEFSRTEPVASLSPSELRGFLDARAYNSAVMQILGGDASAALLSCFRRLSACFGHPSSSTS